MSCNKAHSPSDPCGCMELPKGKTCADCAHFKRCEALFGCDPENTECDWAPSRFKDKGETMSADDLKFFLPVYQQAFEDWQKRGFKVFAIRQSGKIAGFEVRYGTAKISYRTYDEQIVLERTGYVEEVRNMKGDSPERIIGQVNEWLEVLE